MRSQKTSGLRVSRVGVVAPPVHGRHDRPDLGLGKPGGDRPWSARPTGSPSVGRGPRTALDQAPAGLVSAASMRAADLAHRRTPPAPVRGQYARRGSRLGRSVLGLGHEVDAGLGALLAVIGRGARQRVLAAARLRERDHLADRVGPTSSVHDAVPAEGDAAVRRRAVLRTPRAGSRTSPAPPRGRGPSRRRPAAARRRGGYGSTRRRSRCRCRRCRRRRPGPRPGSPRSGRSTRPWAR